MSSAGWSSSHDRKSWRTATLFNVKITFRLGYANYINSHCGVNDLSLTRNYHHTNGEHTFIVRLGGHIAKAHRCHARHGEIQRRHIHCLPRWPIHQFRQIGIVRPHYRVRALRHIGQFPKPAVLHLFKYSKCKGIDDRIFFFFFFFSFPIRPSSYISFTCHIILTPLSASLRPIEYQMHASQCATSM